MPSQDPFLVPTYDLHIRIGSDPVDTVAVTVADHHPLPIPVVGHHLAFDEDDARFVVTEVVHVFGAHHRVRVYAEPVGKLPCDIEDLPEWLQRASHIHPVMR